METEEHPLDRAARLVGGRSNLASQLRVTPAAVGNWKSRGVPVEHCAEIERLTGGQVRRPQLRPIDWLRIWPELALNGNSAPTQPAELGSKGDGEAAAVHVQKSGRPEPLNATQQGCGGL